MSGLKTSDRLSWKSRLKKQNAIIEALRPLLRLEIQSGDTNTILQSETNTVIQVSGGGGVPEGYVEQAVTLCVNGAGVSGKILFKADP
jgi:hypothetical protein